MFFNELLVNALYPPLAFLLQALEQLGLNPDLVFTDPDRHFSLLRNDRAHGVTAEAETTSYLVQAHPLLVQRKHGLALVRFDHAVS